MSAGARMAKLDPIRLLAERRVDRIPKGTLKRREAEAQAQAQAEAPKKPPASVKAKKNKKTRSA